MAPSRSRPFANTEPSPAEAAVLTKAVTLRTRIYRYSFPRAIQAYRSLLPGGGGSDRTTGSPA
jgi:hypothetical protein